MPSDNKWITLFKMSIDTEPKHGDFERYVALIKKLFGRDELPPDVDLFISDHKRDPDGAQKFAKYMTRYRPKGKYWFPRERAWKTDREMKDALDNRGGMKYEVKLVESAIDKIIRRVLTESKK